MTHVRIDQLQRAASQDGYAVPHMLGASIEMLLGAIKAAETRSSPLALGFAPEVFAMVPLDFGLPMLVNGARRSAMPVATQLEHGHDFDTVLRAIRLGVSSVMFDGSGLPYEENVRQTRQVVHVAHAFEVAVEGELGSVGGSALPNLEGKPSLFTEPEDVADFVTRTGVDTLAISFGNVHGPYRGEPRLDFERVRRIRALVDIPLVMHGGSGLTPGDYRRCVESGISNIHFYTGIAVGVWGHLQQGATARGGSPVYHELVGWNIDHFYHEALRVIDMLGSAGHAAELRGLPPHG
jgi:fructose-bisphosphate aldolase class II